MKVNFGKITVEIDADSTRAYYSSYDSTNDCDCTGCVNYREYTKQCDPAIPELLRSFGIDDLNYITEIIPYGSSRVDYDKYGGMTYGGFYHVVGKPLTAQQFTREDTEMIITDKFQLSLADRAVLVPEGFPQPVLQIEIWAKIPWVISCENDYLI